VSDAGGLKPGTILGEEAKPPFAVLPDPASLFHNRSARLTALAPGHELNPYLRFLALLTRAQHAIQTDLPPPTLPSFERISQALAHGMPPISYALYEPDDTAMGTVVRFLARLASAELPSESAGAVQTLLAAPREELRKLASTVLKDVAPVSDVASRVLALAALQVQFTRMAALLNEGDLKLVANGACPVCGSAPVTSAVVGWAKAHNTRFCSCSLCGTMWNVVRVTCLLCNSTDGISYRAIDGNPDTVKAETCELCGSYVKILYQVKDPALDPVADDVATLGLDMLLMQDGWKRGGHNPFLLGY